MEYNYYIHRDSFATDPQGLKPGVRIEKIPSFYQIKFEEGEGPFEDLRGLRKQSSIFKELLLVNPNRAQQVCQEKNIHVVKDLVLTKEEFSVGKDFIRTFEHCIKGKVKNGNVTGIHYYDPKRVRIIKYWGRNSQTEVWKAEIEFLDIDTNKWIRKKSPTTFFPSNWIMHQLFHECKYAVDNMKIKPGSKSVFESKTKTGIRVEVVCVNKELKSIYPLLD